MSNNITTNDQTPTAPPVGSSVWLARTLVATLYLVAGVGCVAYAINFRITGDMPNCLLAGAGGVCGCFASIGIICAR